MTTTDIDAPQLQMPVVLAIRTAGEGGRRSFVMVVKLTTVPRTSVRDAVGVLSESDMIRFGGLMLAFLGIGV